MRRILPCIIVAMLLGSCRPISTDRVPAEAPETAETFSPLDTPADREIVPELYPVKDVRVSRLEDSLKEVAERNARKGDSAAAPLEVYRIQLYMSRLVGEAGRERAMASRL